VFAGAVDSGVSSSTLSRHLPVLDRCVGPRDRALVLASCARDGRRSGGGLGNLILLTRYRLVVTSESRLLRRLRLHLNVGLCQLTEVAWTPEPAERGVALSATAVDGVREHLWIRVGAQDLVWRLDALLREAFTAAA
jgi:hypothetical protein